MAVSTLKSYETAFAQLVDFCEDFGGYITYVFQILDEDNIAQMQTKYILCVRYPNWEHKSINIGETGYLKVKEVFAGKDQWFDGQQFHYYKYDDVIFYKFIEARPTAEVITI